MSLKNKVAIVTGGNSGIGQAIVLELASQGASVVVDYIAHPEATEALDPLTVLNVVAALVANEWFKLLERDLKALKLLDGVFHDLDPE